LTEHLLFIIINAIGDLSVSLIDVNQGSLIDPNNDALTD
jgi:hypothetical protein